MEHIKFYEISEAYINYLAPHAPHLFHNSKATQANTRKYLGIIFHVHSMNYFAPLSSFKEKHEKMKEGMDFLKIGRYAVINLNTMFPVPNKECKYVDFGIIRNKVYKDLLLAEYRIVKKLESKIRKRAEQLYHHKEINGNNTPLAQRCNDFAELEKLCREYKKNEELA
ncbi:MAG: type III toxin-antitoxin system ToxN/AbiQ family toxin [Selenomonadaceae bacterium]|nr:type III toxin-antitoxin system ToxN/AbiQ family toxin [Selenomonadaceae bacterium]